VIARRQIAEVLVRSLTSPQADRKAFELAATAGAAQQDFEPLFAAIDAYPPGSLDAVHDTANMPLEDEPQRVRDELDVLTRNRPVLVLILGDERRLDAIARMSVYALKNASRSALT
jgi:hypothetical protein